MRAWKGRQENPEDKAHDASDARAAARRGPRSPVAAGQSPADVEAIRGVSSAEVLERLMEKGLVRLAGRDESLGRPALYETTRKFLQLFGLRSLAELPPAEGLGRGPRE